MQQDWPKPGITAPTNAFVQIPDGAAEKALTMLVAICPPDTNLAR